MFIIVLFHARWWGTRSAASVRRDDSAPTSRPSPSCCYGPIIEQPAIALDSFTGDTFHKSFSDTIAKRSFCLLSKVLNFYLTQAKPRMVMFLAHNVCMSVCMICSRITSKLLIIIWQMRYQLKHLYSLQVLFFNELVNHNSDTVRL